MQIEVRPIDRLRGKNAVDLAPVLTALANAARDGTVDLSRLRVVLDYVQYRQNFRNAVDVRQVHDGVNGGRTHNGGAATASEPIEVALDLRRTGSVDIDRLLGRALGVGETVAPRRHYCEAWQPIQASCIWAFNGLYWNHLGLWEEATGREYEQALPGGETDARNTAAAQELILELFRVWDGLAARRALPEDLHVLEVGVGNGNQAKVWLDEFFRLDQELHQGEYYRRLHYLMGDYSPHVLERARQTVKRHAEKTSSLAFDARMPRDTLGFLRGKAFLIYISNVYDNLPTDEIVRFGSQVFRVEVRAYVPGSDADKIAAELNIQPDELPGMVARLLDLGPELLARAAPDRFPNGPSSTVALWRSVWEALKLEERYVLIEGIDAYDLAPGVSGDVLRQLTLMTGDVRMHTNNGAAASFVDSLPLLHPFGILQCHDLFVTDLLQYKTGFRGPGKYDGSVVNWVNGPLLASIGRRFGFEVTFQPFAHRPGSNITTMSARVRE